MFHEWNNNQHSMKILFQLLHNFQLTNGLLPEPLKQEPIILQSLHNFSIILLMLYHLLIIDFPLLILSVSSIHPISSFPIIPTSLHSLHRLPSKKQWLPNIHINHFLINLERGLHFLLRDLLLVQNIHVLHRVIINFQESLLVKEDEQ